MYRDCMNCPSSSLTCPSPLPPLPVGDPDFYKSRLVSALGGDFSSGGFTVEKKADATYRVVSAGVSGGAGDMKCASPQLCCVLYLSQHHRQSDQRRAAQQMDLQWYAAPSVCLCDLTVLCPYCVHAQALRGRWTRTSALDIHPTRDACSGRGALLW